MNEVFIVVQERFRDTKRLVKFAILDERQCRQSLLDDAKENLRPKKRLGTLQSEFGDARFQVFIAVSDQGIIKRKGSNPPELMKAERVVKELLAKAEVYQATQGVKGFVKLLASLNTDA